VKTFLQIFKSRDSLCSRFGKKFNENFFNTAGDHVGDVCPKIAAFCKRNEVSRKSLRIQSKEII
jgi:hypothetical protein